MMNQHSKRAASYIIVARRPILLTKKYTRSVGCLAGFHFCWAITELPMTMTVLESRVLIRPLGKTKCLLCIGASAISCLRPGTEKPMEHAVTSGNSAHSI